MPSKDLQKIKKYRDAWYYANKEKQIERQKNRRRELRSLIWEYKRKQSCNECGLSFLTCPEKCDFHHLDPSKKEGSIGQMVGKSYKSILIEIEKCICLCANCHRTVHFKQEPKE